MNRLFNNDIQLLAAMLAPSMRDIFRDNARKMKSFIRPQTVDIFTDLEESMPKDVNTEGLKTILELKNINEDKDLILKAYDMACNADTTKLVYDSVRETLYQFFINSIQGDSIKLINAIKNNDIFFPDFGIMNSEYTRTLSFGNLAIRSDTLDLGMSFKSSFDFINSLTIGRNGYYQDQVIVISSCPGSGKSLFCMNEAIAACSQGLHVHYTALGDLTEFDFISRPTSILMNKPMMDVMKDLSKNYADVLSKNPYMNNLTIDFCSPGVFTVNEWIDMLKHSGELEKNDVFIVDYDTNFRSDKESIYLKGDEIYTALVLLAKTYHKIVIAVAQPKQQTWGKQMDLTALSESSRKQQHVDIMITLAPQFDVANTGNSIGELSVVKNRRGSTGRTKYFREPTGKFSEISRALFVAAQSSLDLMYYQPFEGCETDSHYIRLVAPDIIDDINALNKSKDEEV